MCQGVCYTSGSRAVSRGKRFEMASGRAPGKRLLVPPEVCTGEGGRPKRSRRSDQLATAPPVPEELKKGAAERPTAAERSAAEHTIATMRQLEVTPRILLPNVPADAAVVACSLALHFGQDLGSDRHAKEIFGVAATTDVRGRWVDGKIASLLEAKPGALDSVAPVFCTTAGAAAAADASSAECRRSDHVAGCSADAAPAAAPAAAAAEEAEADGVEAAAVDAAAVEAPADAAPPIGAIPAGLRYSIERVREDVVEYKRRRHLVHYHSNSPVFYAGLRLCPSPAVILRDFAAGMVLPVAGTVIEHLLTIRQAANAHTAALQARLALADKQIEVLERAQTALKRQLELAGLAAFLNQRIHDAESECDTYVPAVSSACMRHSWDCPMRGLPTDRAEW